MKLTLALYLLVKLGFLIINTFLNNMLHTYLVNIFPEISRATFILIYKVFLLKSLAQHFKKRYEFLSYSTRKLFRHPEHPHFIIMMKIKRMEKLVKLLYLLSEEMNYIFGITIFLCTLLTVFGCLYSVGFVLSGWQAGELTYVQLVDMFTECGTRLVFIYQITMALDRVQNAAKKVTKIIHKAKLLTKNEEILEELRFFAKYSKELVPKFTAGWFKVDRYLLSTSLGAIATYLIVIIQFSILPDHEET
ncbi:putative gustatory receptor 28b [Euwallacea similis]|uniref:putative gustatory receptor 28b n=1 Tax=Euwallacea similis TaxID=1736056 RepID=UPI00344CF856